MRWGRQQSSAAWKEKYPLAVRGTLAGRTEPVLYTGQTKRKYVE
jgi:hypothetical protein